MSTSRYRERHSTSGAKSDPGDAKVLAELARTDGHNHRPVAGDSELGEAIKVLARAHQSMIWTRQRQLNQLRSTLREFYPAALEAFDELGSQRRVGGAGDRADTDAGPRPVALEDRLRVAARWPATPHRRTSRSRSRPRCAAEQLEAPPIVADAMGATVTALVAVAVELTAQIARLETELADHFEQHPDAKIIRSLPGLGMILGARVLAEFGDDPNRYADAKCRKNYAGTSPITRASGKTPRRARPLRPQQTPRRRLLPCGPSPRSPPAPAPEPSTTNAEPPATPTTAPYEPSRNRLVGILHGCLRPRHPLRRTHRLGPPHTNSPLDTYDPWDV